MRALGDQQRPSRTWPRRCYGFYKCTCGRKWESAFSWANFAQECKRCDSDV